MKLNEITLPNEPFPDPKINPDLYKETINKLFAQYSYTINPDFSIDFNENVFKFENNNLSIGRQFSKNKFKKIPFKIRKVTGDFVLKECNFLQTLENCPDEVTGSFMIHKCRGLKNLVGSPKKVGDLFAVLGTSLPTAKFVSLDGITPNIGGQCRISDHTSLKSVKALKTVTCEELYIWGCWNIEDFLNVLKTKTAKISALTPKITEILMKYLSDRDIMSAQEELIDAGFERYAKL